MFDFAVVRRSMLYHFMFANNPSANAIFKSYKKIKEFNFVEFKETNRLSSCNIV